MTGFWSKREVAAALPWVGAVLLWFGVMTPLRAGPAERLTLQGELRRDRAKSDRALREAQALQARIAAALGSTCRASADPAALRQRTIAATQGLAISPFMLSVAGGPGGGATVEAEGSRGAVLELLRRLGDPAEGGFVRSAAIREEGSRAGVSVVVGVLGRFPPELLGEVADCPDASGRGPIETATPEIRSPARSLSARIPAPAPSMGPIDPEPGAPEPASPPAPFTLVAFLRSEGRSLVSLRVGDEIRVVSVGDEVNSWKCVSIDRDEGAVFASLSGARLILKAGQ